MTRALVWALISAPSALLAFLPAAVIGTWVADVAGGGSPVRLGVAAGLWTLLGTGIAVGLARLMVPADRPMTRAVLLVTVGGALAASISQSAMAVSAEARYGGLFEPDYVGWAVLLAPGVTALTGGLASSLVTSGAARLISRGVVWLSISGIGLLALDSAPGVLDGISPSGWPAGIAFGVAAAFGAWAVLVLARQSSPAMSVP